MTERSENTVKVTPELRAAAKAEITPEFLEWFDSLTNEDIARQIADNPDAAPELTDEWFENARLVIPLKSRKHAA